MAAGKDVYRWLGKARLTTQSEKIDLGWRFGIHSVGAHPIRHPTQSSYSRPAGSSIQQALQLEPAKPTGSISRHHIVLQLPLVATCRDVQQRSL